jgi:TraR antiactivator
MHHAEDTDLDARRSARISDYGALDRAELETLAVSTIQELRLLVGTAQILYEEWLQADKDSTSSASVMSAMQADYVRRQRELLDLQNTLDEMLQALGYVPKVSNAS